MTLSDDLTLPLLQVKTSLEMLENKNFSKAGAREHTQETYLNIDSGLQLV
jgi:hypothetical protein